MSKSQTPAEMQYIAKEIKKLSPLLAIEKNGSALVAVSITLAGELTKTEAVNIIQEVHYDLCGADGNFRVLPDDSNLFTEEFVFSANTDAEENSNTPSTLAISQCNGNTTIFILMASCIRDTFSKELACLTSELDEFLGTEHCVKWGQLDISNSSAS